MDEEVKKAALRAYLSIMEQRLRKIMTVLDDAIDKIDPTCATPAQSRLLSRFLSTREVIDRSLFNIEKYHFKMNEDEIICPF